MVLTCFNAVCVCCVYVCVFVRVCEPCGEHLQSLSCGRKMKLLLSPPPISAASLSHTEKVNQLLMTQLQTSRCNEGLNSVHKQATI